MRGFDAFFQLVDGAATAAKKMLRSAHRAFLEVKIGGYACRCGRDGGSGGEDNNGNGGMSFRLPFTLCR